MVVSGVMWDAVGQGVLSSGRGTFVFGRQVPVDVNDNQAVVHLV